MTARTGRVGVRVGEAEMFLLKEAAKAHRMTLAAFVRDSAIRRATREYQEKHPLLLGAYHHTPEDAI
jgi:uncharacterized protein (DUF1778 family)